VPILLRHFLEAFSTQYRVTCPSLSAGALAMLTDYGWPGNVRELKNVVERLIVRNRTDLIHPEDLPLEVVRRAAPAAPAPEAAREVVSVPDMLFDAMVTGRESFWSVVYAPFMSRDLTREHLREVVRKGLERTSGNYKVMIELFNMPAQDYKRFLGFLRKYHCHMPFQQFRSAAASRPSGGSSDPHNVALTA
jgi:DNA-binding NtrC family response regulator